MRKHLWLLAFLVACNAQPPVTEDQEPAPQSPQQTQMKDPPLEKAEPEEEQLPGPTGETGNTGPTGQTGPTFEFPIVNMTAYAVNIINAAVPAELARFLTYDAASGVPDGDLRVATQAFYALFGDTYDYLYIVTDKDVSGGDYGRSKAIHRAAIPGIGHKTAINLTDFGSTRLKNVIVLRWMDNGGGPTAHETMHSWGMHLDATLGFGVDQSSNYGSHWGVTGANGQLGGFNPATLRCASPKSSTPLDCNPISAGRYRYYVDSYGTFANGGDTKPYSPIELYLMGLVPAADVQPIMRPKNADTGYDGTIKQTYIDADKIEYVSVQDIITKHGARPLATPSEKALTAAFVVFSEQALSAEKFKVVDEWAAVFGNHRPGKRPSFETLTGNRATMRTRLDDPLP